MSRRSLGLVHALIGCVVVVVAVVPNVDVPRLIVTKGASMQPTLAAGDLVLLVPDTACSPGAVSAYGKASETVLHRVVGQQNGRCVLKGDNNSWTDPDRPLPSALLGTLVLRIPGGGVWWHRLTSPVLLGVVAFALISLTGTSPAARRARRRRRQSGRPLPRPLSPL